MPTVGNGDYLVRLAIDEITYRYYTSTTVSGIAISDGWVAEIGYGSTGARSFYDSINGKYVKAIYGYIVSGHGGPTITSVSGWPSHLEYVNLSGITTLKTIPTTFPSTLKSLYLSFMNCTGLTNCPATIPNSVTSMLQAFYGCTSLLNGPTTLGSSVTDMMNAFMNCSKMTTGPTAIPNSVTTLQYAFSGCSALTAGPSTIGTGVTIMNGAFSGCSAMVSGPSQIPNSVLKASYAFSSCRSLVNGPSSLGSNLTDMSSMFIGCASMVSGPQSIPASVTSMNYAFSGCNSLENAPSFANADDVTTMISTFQNCTNITSIDHFPANLIHATKAFCNCSALESIPSTLPSSDLMFTDSMFEGCTSLLTAPQTIPVTVTNATSMFASSGIENAPEILADLTSMGYMFQYCENLEAPSNIPDSVVDLSSTFGGCSSMEASYIKIPDDVNILNGTFWGCTSLSGVIEYNGVATDTTACFFGVANTIILIGSSEQNQELADTSLDGYVITGLKLSIESFGSIRCDADGVENPDGDYAELTALFTSTDFPGIKLKKPTLTSDELEIIYESDWTLNGTSFPSGGLTVPTEGTLRAIVEVPSSGVYFHLFTTMLLTYQTPSGTEVFEWTAESGSSVLTSKTFIYDATPDGRSFKIGGAIDEENEEGFIVGNDAEDDPYPSSFNGPVNLNSQEIYWQSKLLLNVIYPVGSIYMTTDETVNPNEWPGQFDCWIRWGAGKVPVGVDENDTDFASAELTGGAKGAWRHSHGSGTFNVRGGDTDGKDTLITGSSGIVTRGTTTVSKPHHVMTTTSSGNVQYQVVTITPTTNGSTNNTLAVDKANMPPYISCFMWKKYRERRFY